MSRKIKSSSGDTSYVNPYMKKWVGHEVTTSTWKKGKPVMTYANGVWQIKLRTKVL